MVAEKISRYLFKLAKLFSQKQSSEAGKIVHSSSKKSTQKKLTGDIKAESRESLSLTSASKTMESLLLINPIAEDIVLAQAEWVDDDLSLTHRDYKTYGDYIKHQKSKLNKIDLTKYDEEYRQTLAERLRNLSLLNRGDSVLCIAARIGTECKAFIDLGCFPIGIDLNPGVENKYVVHGDFHNLQFSEGSVDYVFTNSLDHAFELDRVVQEVFRVLKKDGAFIAEIVGGSLDDHGRDPGLYESVWWGKVDDVVYKVEKCGFRVESNQRFDYPWRGYQVVFRKIG